MDGQANDKALQKFADRKSTRLNSSHSRASRMPLPLCFSLLCLTCIRLLYAGILLALEPYHLPDHP